MHQQNFTKHVMNTPESNCEVEISLPFDRGAEWVRVDFHLHTKADKEFKYQDGEDRFISNYVEKLSETGIQIGVITNHNKFDRNEFCALRKKARKSGIQLLPGVELSIGDGQSGVHALVVFSDEWIADGKDFINPLLGNCFVGKEPVEYENENGCTDYDISTCIQKIVDCKKPFFLVFAHVEQDKGIVKELRGRIKNVSNAPLFREYTLGFQKVRNNDQRAKVKEWLSEWYPAEVEGSDPKKIEEIGKGQHCYLKVGERTFEAVRFALFDHVQRVRLQVPPENKACRLDAIRFEGARLDGKEIKWSSSLNCLIGPRGNGKSAIIECCRHALGISLADRADSGYKEELVQSFLSPGGKIVLDATDEFGRKIRIERERNSAPSVFVDGAYHEVLPSAVLRDILYFGQKDLSVRSESFDESFLDRLLADRLISNNQEEQRLIQDVERAVKGLVTAIDASEKTEAYRKEIETLQVQLKVYTDKGVDSKLLGMTEFDADKQALLSWQSKIKELGQQLQMLEPDWAEVISDFPATKSSLMMPVKDELVSLREKLAGLMASSKSISEELTLLNASLVQLLQRLDPAQSQLKEELSELQQALNEPNLDLDLFRKKKARLEQLKKLLAAGTSRGSTLQAAQDILGASAQVLHEARRKWFNEREVEVKRIQHELPDEIGIQTGFKGNRKAFENFLRSVLKGTGIQSTAYETIADKFADGWDLYRRRAELENFLSETAALKIKTALAERLSEFVTYRVPDTTEIVYQNIPLGQYSLGQRATVILHILMHVKRYPVIIIDQPEDDLDNETLYTHFVRQLLERKEDTQFIFATHNANIPVLGDAEQVIVCRRQDQEFQFENGSIDAKAVQERVITVMEGGSEAFKRRKDIYRQWKNTNSENN